VTPLFWLQSVLCCHLLLVYVVTERMCVMSGTCVFSLCSVGRLKRQMAEICVKSVLAVADLGRRDVNLDLIKVCGGGGGGRGGMKTAGVQNSNPR
jgi:hypothetical protein